MRKNPITLVMTFLVVMGCFSFVEASTVASQPIYGTEKIVWVTGTGSGVANTATSTVYIGTPFSSDTYVSGFSIWIGDVSTANSALNTRLYYSDTNTAFCTPTGNTTESAGTTTENIRNSFKRVFFSCTRVLVDHTRPIKIDLYGGSDANQTSVKVGSNGFKMFYEITDDGQYTNYVGIDFNAIDYNPLPFSTTSIATSSALWASINLASTTVQCDSGNIFSDGICSAFSYLLIPNPNVVNNFFALEDGIAQKFPFSWFYSVNTELESLQSSTSSMITLSYNLHDMGIGSTTAMGNFLPNVDVFSKDTIEEYIGSTLWNTFQLLIAGALWLGFILHIYHSVRHLAQPH